MRTGLVVLIGLTVVLPASAQTEAWRFRWSRGQVLDYRIEHVTSVAETVGGSEVKTTSKLNLTKRWRVVEVDGQGTGTLELSLVAMRNEQTRPNGETFLFDSANPDKGTPELKEQLMQFIGKPLAVLKVDAAGRVLDAGQGSLAKFEAEPPFALILGDATAGPGQGWERQYQVTLEPPAGTGEKYAAVQHYTCQSLSGPLATLALKTEIKSLPESLLDRVPLFQKQPEGKVVFDVQHGRLHSADLSIRRDLENHQGPGSRYFFESRYREEFVSER
jgi:hypothetical protein